MKSVVKCPGCAMAYSLNEEQRIKYEGKKTKCPQCGQDFKITFPDEQATEVVSLKTQKGHYKKARLEVMVNEATKHPQQFELRPDKTNTIGRFKDAPNAPRADFAIETDDLHMSKQHCAIEVIPRAEERYQFLISDLDSVNGTFLNDAKLARGEKIFLLNGDHLRLGKTILQFIGESQQDETEYVPRNPQSD